MTARENAQPRGIHTRRDLGGESVCGLCTGLFAEPQWSLGVEGGVRREGDPAVKAILFSYFVDKPKRFGYNKSMKTLYRAADSQTARQGSSRLPRES